MMRHHRRWRRCGRSAPTGFTLVELLVVITIIGILIGLLIPAVQAAREAGRRATCKNNLKQLGLACQLHETRHRFLPTGGWTYRWAGDPDRGFTNKQPGGWHYSILPFIEQEDLHNLGADGTNRRDGQRRAEMPLKLFHCPTRRRALAYPYMKSGTDVYVNIGRPGVIGRSDYAACAGDVVLLSDSGGPSGDHECQWPGPRSLPDGDDMSEPGAQPKWEDYPGSFQDATGVIFRRSMVKFAHVQDGESCTYLLGEKHLCAANYTNGEDLGDDQGWDVGYDCDTNRWTANDARCLPRRDRAGDYEALNSGEFAFGSAHATGFNMVFCDGSVQTMHYDIDRQTHAYLGNRKDMANVEPPK